MIGDIHFYVIAVPALMLMGVSKGAFGSGIGSLATPMLALIVPPMDAAAIVLPILCTMDAMGIWSYRGKWSWPQLRYLLPGAVLGIAIGTLTAGLFDGRAIGLLIGVLAVVFSLDWFLRRGSSRPPQPSHRGRASLWAVVSGFTSFIAHAGGPPLSAYLLPQRLDRTVYAATAVMFFTLVNIVKLVPYAGLGLFHEGNLWTTLVLLPVAPAGMGLGLWLHDKIPAVPFYRICYVMVFASGVKLVIDNIGVLA